MVANRSIWQFGPWSARSTRSEERHLVAHFFTKEQTWADASLAHSQYLFFLLVRFVFPFTCEISHVCPSSFIGLFMVGQETTRDAAILACALARYLCCMILFFLCLLSTTVRSNLFECQGGLAVWTQGLSSSPWRNARPWFWVFSI